MSFDIPPLPLEAAVPQTKFTTDAAGSLLGARRCDFKARPTSARDAPSRPNLVDGHPGSWLSARRTLPS